MQRAKFVWMCLSLAAGPALAEEAKCCFTNSAYSGVCEVVPAKDETCQSILQYLNTPNTVGKAYCGGTSIRGGWQQVACKTSSSAIATSDDRTATAQRPVHPVAALSRPR